MPHAALERGTADPAALPSVFAEKAPAVEQSRRGLFLSGGLGGSGTQRTLVVRPEYEVGSPMHCTPSEIKGALLHVIPRLRAFAISLTGSLDRADDLVQDTLLRAIENSHRFERGTNLQAWTFTILRNLFLSECRKRWREVADPNSEIAGKVGVAPEQGARLELKETLSALGNLSPDQRAVVLLIGAEGLSYEETAEICGTTVGTVKSRINRGRTRLAELLGAEKPHYGSVRAA